jgi:phage replication O-like protein O
MKTRDRRARPPLRGGESLAFPRDPGNPQGGIWQVGSANDEGTKGANPQAEDGHTDIANEIAEALAKVNLSAYESRTLWVILRKTYGWHKKMDRISITQFEKATGLKRRHVHRTLCKLVERNIVTRTGNSRIISYGFQKDYTKWEDITKRGNDVGMPWVNGQPEKRIVTLIGNRSLPKGVPTKEINKRKHLYADDSIECQLAALLLKEIQNNKPNFKRPNLQAWAKEIDLIIWRDGRKPERIREVILWCQRHYFWWKNVLSTGKLRKQFDRLEIEMEDKKKDPSKTEMRFQYQDLTGRGTA